MTVRKYNSIMEAVLDVVFEPGHYEVDWDAHEPKEKYMGEAERVQPLLLKESNDEDI